MNAHLFCIECLTNLHVGSGESNYNIIDNEVERDPVLKNVPVIHASGVKGALRAHCKEILSAEQVKSVFGDASDAGNTNSGAYKFFTANLLARPLRVSQGNTSYVLTTTEEILEKLEWLAKGLGAALELPKEEALKVQVEGQDMPVFSYTPKELFGEKAVAIAPGFDAFDLPSLARNCLDKDNPNLWYEEIVPYTSRFYFFVLAPDVLKTDDKTEFKFTTFSEKLTKAPVQFGGNASVGYGYCNVKEVVLP